jgi:hypothetical protein
MRHGNIRLRKEAAQETESAVQITDAESLPDPFLIVIVDFLSHTVCLI